MYELRIPFTFHSGFAHLVGSCNGILCLTDYRTNRHSMLNDVFLWNPSIRMFKRLSSTCFKRRRLHDFQLEFAYHSQNNDFKVVRISKHFRNSMYPPEVEVYTLSSDSWKRIELGISWRPNVLIYDCNCGFSFPFVCGHLHWLLDITEGSGQHKYRSDMILSFDVNSEKFRKIPLPNDDSFKGINFVKCLTMFKEKLALFQFQGCLQPHVPVCFVWVMKEYGVPESWNKLYEVPIENLTIFGGFTKYGTLIIRTNSGLVEGLEEEDRFVLIDPKTLHEQDITIQLNYPLDIATFHVSTAAYMENLALLDGANVVSY
nr:F-box protein At3g07870-like [Quercus suber]